jgi:CDP-diacylglycerol---glycerol-3-phosphate 3-phosphatidyltransferase
MPWPHLLSLSRVIAGPIIAALILARPGNAYLVAAIVFGLASLTDLIDGKLARLSQSVSPFGVFLDTTSDKVMVSLTLVALSTSGLLAVWMTLVIIGREFLISGLRSYAASRRLIISAHVWGKGKTALTIVAIFLLLLAADGRSGGLLARLGSHHLWTTLFSMSVWLVGAATALTIISGIRYFIDALPLFQSDPEVPEVPAHPPAA